MAKGGRGGAGRGDGAGARPGRGARLPRDSTVLTCRASEMGGSMELGDNIFTISSGNKVRDDDTLCTTKEAMILYIGTHYSEDTSKEFGTGEGAVVCKSISQRAYVGKRYLFSYLLAIL